MAFSHKSLKRLFLYDQRTFLQQNHDYTIFENQLNLKTSFFYRTTFRCEFLALVRGNAIRLILWIYVVSYRWCHVLMSYVIFDYLSIREVSFTPTAWPIKWEIKFRDSFDIVDWFKNVYPFW